MGKLATLHTYISRFLAGVERGPLAQLAEQSPRFSARRDTWDFITVITEVWTRNASSQVH